MVITIVKRRIRRSKLNEDTMTRLTKGSNGKFWKKNPNCKDEYYNLVQKQEEKQTLKEKYGNQDVTREGL